MDRDSQMKAIEKTFEDNKKPVEKHYSKPNVHAVETLNVFPDFKVTLDILIVVIELFNCLNNVTYLFLIRIGDFHVLKLSLILIQLQWVGLFQLKLKKCLKL